MIFTAIPLSIIGGVFLLALRGMPFSISAGVGFIALFGVVVLNGIVLIAKFNRMKKSGVTNIVYIVVRGAKSRLRPVLMTACVASFGFLPMALSNGASAEVQRPLATVVIGGLLLATFLTLSVLPLLYITFEQKLKFFKKKTVGLASVLLVLSQVSSFTQTPISLNQAIETVLEQNQAIRTEKLKAAYNEALTRTAFDLGKTQVSSEFGQLNGPYTDNKLNISQSFAFPSVYAKQRKLYDAEWQQSLISVHLKAYEVEKAVTQCFYDWIYWSEKEALLQQADSLYTAFSQKATLRLSKGESTIMEKATAQNIAINIHTQLNEVRKTKQTIQMNLQYLLNYEA